MTTWILVWFVIALTTTVLVAAFLIALVRHGILLGRAAARLGAEAGSLAAEIGQGAARASDRMSRIGPNRPQGPRR